MTLRAGDMLVFHGIWRDLAKAAAHRDFVVVTDFPKEEQRPHKLWVAMAIFGLALALALIHQVAVPVALMAGAVAMVIAGVLNMDEAYGTIQWKTIFVMACLIPLGVSMDSTGTAAWIAQEIMRYIGNLPQWVLQAFVAILALGFSQVISNVGAAVMMVPMAINIALASNGNPAVYALIVAISTSNSFLIASANPVLTLVAGPGGYRARDFLRVGVPLTALMLAVMLVTVNTLFR